MSRNSNDFIRGNKGDDELQGRLDNDILRGSAGNDLLNGNLGEDRLFGGDDNDTLVGAQNDDALFGQNGEDILLGGKGNDSLKGGADNDTLSGNTGNDNLDGGDGADILNGGKGDDNLAFVLNQSPTAGVDNYNGGDDFDTLDLVGDASGLDTNAIAQAIEDAAGGQLDLNDFGLSLIIEKIEALHVNGVLVTPEPEDTTHPTLSISMDKSDLAAGDTATVTFQFSEEVQGFALGDISAPNGTMSNLQQDGTDPTKYTATFTPTSNTTADTNVISVAAGDYADLAGNLGTVAQSANYEVNTDITAPSLTITMDDNDLAAGETAIVTFQFSEEVQGFSLGDISAPNGTLAGLTQDSGDLSKYTATFTPNPDTTDANNMISVAAASYQDLAGNVGQAATSPNYAVDTAPAVDTSIVILDLTSGNSSDHSDRTFQDNVSYDIYIKVQSTAVGLTSLQEAERWSGEANLGADDSIILVGDGPNILGYFVGAISTYDQGPAVVTWYTSSGAVAGTLSYGVINRAYTYNWAAAALWGSSEFQSYPSVGFDNTLPAGILTSQGLV